MVREVHEELWEGAKTERNVLLSLQNNSAVLEKP